MTYTEKELDQFLHGISLSLLSKKSAQHWRYDEETAKEIEWLEALERKVRADKADRKNENSSEKPNNCEPQTDCGDFADRLAYERGVKHAWEVAQKVFNSTVTFYEAEDVAKQIDKDINVRSKDEPHTERSE